MKKRGPYLTKGKITKTKPAIISQKAKKIAERIIEETRYEERQANLKLARKFEYRHLEEESIQMQETMFERLGFKKEDIRELREKVIEEKLTVEEIADELEELRHRPPEDLIKNRGIFKRKK
jgi:Holliday junction resolvasome RuvABC DNA-binding subunit